jgi:hypothetical protein
MDCDAIYFKETMSFRRNISPPSLKLKSKANKRPVCLHSASTGFFLSYSSIPKTEAICRSETYVFFQITLCQIQDFSQYWLREHQIQNYSVIGSWFFMLHRIIVTSSKKYGRFLVSTDFYNPLCRCVRKQSRSRRDMWWLRWNDKLLSCTIQVR